MLLVFCFFVVSPAIVKIIDQNTDISAVFSLSEEEHNQEKNNEKELNSVYIDGGSQAYFIISPKTVTLPSNTYQKHYNYSNTDVLVPPPKYII